MNHTSCPVVASKAVVLSTPVLTLRAAADPHVEQVATYTRPFITTGEACTALGMERSQRTSPVAASSA